MYVKTHDTKKKFSDPEFLKIFFFLAYFDLQKMKMKSVKCYVIMNYISTCRHPEEKNDRKKME